MLKKLQSRPVGPSFVPDRSGSSSLVWCRFIRRSMVLLPCLKSFSDIVSPFSFSCLQKLWIFCIYALHRYGICFALNYRDSFVNELSTHQIEKSLRVKHEKFKFSQRTKRNAIRKKYLGLELRHYNSETVHGIFAI